MEHIEDGSYVEVIATGRVGEVVSRKKSNVIVSFYDKSFIHPEDLTFKERELKIVELSKIKTSELGAFVRGDISLTEISNGTMIPQAVFMNIINSSPPQRPAQASGIEFMCSDSIFDSCLRPSAVLPFEPSRVATVTMVILARLIDILRN